MEDDDGEEHLLGTLLSQCRCLCDACVEVVACRKNVVTHMKRKHTLANMYPLIRFSEVFAKKGPITNNGSSSPRPSGFGRASVTQWGLVDGYLLSSTLVPLLSLTDQWWLQSAQVRCPLPQCCSSQEGTSGGWLSSSLPTVCGTLCYLALSPLPVHTHLPIPSSKSQIEADCKSDWLLAAVPGK